MSEHEFSIEVSALDCGYHDKPVLHAIYLHCKPGEIVALLGPNGSGKSTLIRALGGSLRPRKGAVAICGRDLGALNEREIAKLVATVPQEESHRFPFTVRQVVAMGRLPTSSSFFDTEEDFLISDGAMATADCSDLGDRPITELSGGERQRVLIARALAQQTTVLLLDEPTDHLDPSHQLAAAELFRTLASQGRTLVLAAHDLNLAAITADRGVLLREGRVAASLAMRELLGSPILDETYGVRFERLTDAGGRLRVFPAALIS